MQTPQKFVLIVEDEEDLAEILRYNLEREGYFCQHALNSIEALDIIRRRRPDLVLLDRMLPGISGDEVLMRVKRDSNTASIPIIMLTAKVEETDQLMGFALGADDYVTKPFSMKVLLARTAAMLRRAEAAKEDPAELDIGPIKLNAERHEVSIDAEPVSLTATEFRLLRTLMEGRGRVLDRASLIDAVLGPDIVVTERTIDVHITSLRKKIGEAACWVQTVRGVGYTYREPR